MLRLWLLLTGFKPWALVAVVLATAGSQTSPLNFSGRALWASACCLGLSSWLVYFVLLYPRYFSPLRRLPQPTGASLINGHWAASIREPAGLPFKGWMRSVPNQGLIRYLHLFNRERLILTSAEGLKEVLSTNAYDYVKPHLLRALVGKILGYGLLLSEGDVHKLQRKNLMPAFSFRHIKDLYPVLWRKASEMARGIDAERGEREDCVIDIADWASRASMDIIGLAGMGHDFRSLSDPSIENEMKLYGSMIKQSRGAKLLTMLQLILPTFVTDYLPFQRNRGILAASRAARDTSRRLVEEKREQMNRNELKSLDIISTALKSGHFTDGGLVDTMMTFLAAGHETSAAALTWTIYLLARHPHIQQRLRAEIHGRIHGLDNDDAANAVDATTLDSLGYLQAVCQESLRVYAPIPFTVRDTVRDTTILGQFVPRGTMIVICPWAINLSHELWNADGDADADKFNPDRWMGPGRANSGGASTNYAFLTFLHGPRSCIGQKFSVAELMALTCAAVGMFSWEILSGEGEGVDVKDITDGIVAKPKHGLKLRVRRCGEWC